MPEKQQSNGIAGLLNRVINAGITSSLNFEERKRTRLINVMALIGLFLNLVFGLLNYSQQNWSLATVNSLFLLLSLLVLYFHSGYKYRYSIIIFPLFTLLLIAGSFYHNNGMEYVLVVNMVLSMSVFHNRRYALGYAIFNVLALVLIKYIQSKYPDRLMILPAYRLLINLFISIAAMFTVVYYFKKEHLSYEKQIEDKNESLGEMNLAKEQLLTVLAHDMRTPITTIKNVLELLQDGDLSQQDFAEYAAELSVQVNQLQEDLENLLIWSQGQMNGIQPEPAYFTIKDLLVQADRFLQQASKHKQLDITIDCPAETEAFADANHVLVVVRNPLNNAIKFSFAGKRIRLAATVLENNLLQVSVTDEGTGIPAEKLDSLFGYMPGKSTRGTNNEKGTGVGLVLCKAFIEKNGGHIWVESEAEKGSCFKFTLPVTNS